MISPRPVASAVPPWTQKDTSEPIRAPSVASSSAPIPKFHNRFKPRNVAAASELPPASPAATGILFSSVISTPSRMPYVVVAVQLLDTPSFFGHSVQIVRML